MTNLSLDNQLDHNAKPIKVGDDMTPLEVSTNKLWYQKTPTDLYEVANKKYVDDNAITEDKFYLKSSAYINSNAARYLPLTNSTRAESSLSDTGYDDSNFICPYNLKVDTIYISATRSSSGGEIAGNTTLRLFKDGSALSSTITVDMSTIGYDSTDIYTVYTWDFSGETNTYSAGDTMQIQIDPTNKIYYTTTTIVGAYT